MIKKEHNIKQATVMLSWRRWVKNTFLLGWLRGVSIFLVIFITIDAYQNVFKGSPLRIILWAALPVIFIILLVYKLFVSTTPDCPLCHAKKSLKMDMECRIDGVFYARCTSCHTVFPTDLKIPEGEVVPMCFKLNVDRDLYDPQSPSSELTVQKLRIKKKETPVKGVRSESGGIGPNAKGKTVEEPNMPDASFDDFAKKWEEAHRQAEIEEEGDLGGNLFPLIILTLLFPIIGIYEGGYGSAVGAIIFIIGYTMLMQRAISLTLSLIGVLWVLAALLFDFSTSPGLYLLGVGVALFAVVELIPHRIMHLFKKLSWLLMLIGPAVMINNGEKACGIFCYGSVLVWIVFFLLLSRVKKLRGLFAISLPKSELSPSTIPMKSTDKEETMPADVAANEAQPAPAAVAEEKPAPETEPAAEMQPAAAETPQQPAPAAAVGGKKSVKKWLIAGTAILLLGGLGGGIYVATGPHVSKKEARRMGERLVEMCQTGDDWERAATLIEEGANVNISNDEGLTPLMFASDQGKDALVEQLLEAGADINAKEASGLTAFGIACSKGHKKVVKQLLHAGARANKADSMLLPGICKDGDVELTKSLLAAGAQVDAVDADKFRTALLYAAENGHTECVQALLAGGAYVDAWDYDIYLNRRKTALHYAAEKGHTECVKALLAARADVNKKCINEKTALHYAAENGHKECVKALLAAGAKVDASDSLLLLNACKGGDVELTKSLLAAGVQVDAVDAASKRTALLYAAIYGHTECVQALLAGGAYVDAMDDDRLRRKTALHYAAEYGYTECVKALLAAGADVNKECLDEETALHYAAKYGHTECVKALLAAGADVNCLDNGVKNALHYAAEKGHTECVKALLAAGADVNAISDSYYGETALHYAAEKGHTECVKALLAAGADVNAISNIYPGKTALYYAAEKGHTECVKALLAAGAKVDGRALQSAENNSHYDCAKLLKAAGAKK